MTLADALRADMMCPDWRVPNDIPPIPATTQDEARTLETYASYVRILSWFLDDPSPLCPFSVHRMALIGKELGKEVGEWFGPSTAAGAIKYVRFSLLERTMLITFSGHWRTRSLLLDLP